MALPPYDQWMKETNSLTKPRSESLKELDNAIKSRNELLAKRTLINWIDEQNQKRQDWHRSVRNSKGAVERLYKQLGILGTAVASKDPGSENADNAAKLQIRREQKHAAEKMFTGKQLKFKDSFWGISRTRCKNEATKIEQAKNGLKNVALTAKGVGGNVATAAGTTYSVATSLKDVIQTIMGTLPEATHNAIIEQVFGTTVEQFVFNVAPLFGMISSGAKAVWEWGGVAKNIYNATQMEARYGDVRPGDAAAALNSITNIIDRQINKQTADAVIRTTAFTAKSIAAAADFGTATTAVIGAIESVAIILNTLADIVIDAKQMEAGNKAINQGNIDIKLFEICPILGCYYIAIQDHSTIMNFDIANMGKANWKQEAERLKYAIDPVLKKAAELISKSRIEIPGMESAKGVYQSSMWQKVKMYYKSKGYGQDQNLDIIDMAMKGQI